MTLAVAGGGCSRLSGEAGPQLRALDPQGGYVGTPTTLRVLGTGFAVRGVQQISGGQSVSSTFTVVIGGRSLPATPVGMQGGLDVLQLTVPPDLPIGVYDVAVQDPYGAWGTLPRGFTVVTGPPPRLQAQLSAAPTTEVGRPIPATLTVQNTGGATALITQIQLDGAAVPGAGTVAPGASLSFAVWLQAATPGVQQHAAEVLAQDFVTAQPLSPATATTQVDVLAPPALTAVTRAPPASVDVGQPFNLVVDVTNSGGVAALSVVAVPSGGGLVPGTPAPAQDIAAGATATFTLPVSASLAGALPATAAISGTDALTSGLVATSATWRAVQVQTAASLSMNGWTAPAAVNAGQSFPLQLTAGNAGQATAVSVAPASLILVGGSATATCGPASPTSASIAAGQSATFGWTCTATGTGTLTFQARIAGTDANTLATISANGRSPSIPVQSASSLSFSSWTIPSAVDTGQAFTLRVVVANGGQAAAKGVAPSLPAPTSGSVAASCAGPASPAAADIGGGASATFSWTCTAGAVAGSLAFRTTASGTDANSGAPVNASGSSAGFPVQTPAALSATLTAPASGNVGDTLTVSFAVADSGAAAASNVAPAALALSGTATGTVASGPTPASATIAGGSTQTFTWTVTLASAGTLQLSATASGADANSGAAVSASASAPVAVSQAEAVLLTPSNPFGGDGTNFASIFSYQGLVYLGPDYKSQSTASSAAPANTQSGAVSMAPDGTSQKSVPWQLEVQSGARNSAYQGTGVLCHTIGFLGCTKATAQCGPDNEGGRALFASGVINGTEWYMVGGASPIGGVNYLYLTNAGFPLAAGGYDDLAYVQIQAGQFGSTRQLTSARVFGNVLYLGFLDNSASASQKNAPVLNVLNKMPALPGYVANAGSDIVNLNGVYLPAVGILGTPANPGAASGQLQIDSMADVNGALYVANNGGIARSVGAISPCPASGCSNWANATPSGSAWAGQTSVTTWSGDVGTMRLAERGVPWVVPFGGRVFAARNTNNGPQLWSCTPTLQPDDPKPQCHPADWVLVAANSAASGLGQQLTQMNDGNNSAATVLAATSSHLYVGFDNGNGVQIYRTSNAAATQSSDFTGRAGCVAGAAGCQGIGGNGLTTPVVTQFYDGHAFTYSGSEWIYLSAGAGSGGPRIFRLAP